MESQTSWILPPTQTDSLPQKPPHRNSKQTWPTRWKNVFDQPEHFLTENSSNQIAEKTIDFDDSTAQVP